MIDPCTGGASIGDFGDNVAMSFSPAERSTLVKRLAAEHGFDRCSIARLGPIAHAEYFEAWLRAGRSGTMGYLHRYRPSRLDPTKLKSRPTHAIVVALNYRQHVPTEASNAALNPEPRTPNPATGESKPARRGGWRPEPSFSGRVAMYAWGEDYHVVVKDKLDRLLADLRAAIDAPFTARVCVDTSPIVEREIAAAAGIGWIGKNTLVLNRELGSYFVLGEITTDLELAPDSPIEDHCGCCTRCLDACPTQAFPAPYQMDARRCISYLTIEYRGDIPDELKSQMGDWLFGCDVCQQVCPYNEDAPVTSEARLTPRGIGPRPALDAIEAWTAQDHARATTGAATARASLDMWRRNAAIARDNLKSADKPIR